MRHRDDSAAEEIGRNNVDQGAGRRLVGAWFASVIAHAAVLAAGGMVGRLSPPPLPQQPGAISIERILLEPAATTRPAIIAAASAAPRTPDRQPTRAPVPKQKRRARPPLAASAVARTAPPPAVTKVPPAPPVVWESRQAKGVPPIGAAAAAAFVDENSAPVAREFAAPNMGGGDSGIAGSASRGPIVLPVENLVGGGGGGPYGPVKPPAAPVPETQGAPGQTRDAEPSSLSMPAIPDSLKGAPYRSFVRVRVAVSAEGESEITLSDSSGNPEIDQHVIDAMRLWRWKPALRDGRPVASMHHFKFDFAVN
ncbi:MAG TPA: TonB family protein [Armatimonadaceae bacterium]|nr:TonB family protein [Armatimonadaceae bacterium]